MTATEVLIVGAGPIGIELAVTLKRAAVDYLHVDAGQVGSTMQWWAPGTRFFSSPERIAIAGVPLLTANQDKATREEYLTYLRSVAAQFDLPIRTYERVTAIAPRAGGGFDVTTQTRRAEQHYRAARIVLAIGDMHRPRLLRIPGEDLPHVSHYFQDPHTYFRRRVLIVGGKNSAVEAAIRLYRAGCDVTVSYRADHLDAKRVKYWLLPEINWLFDKQRIRFLPRTVPTRITAEQIHLAYTNDALQPTGDPAAITLDPDFVLLLTGYEQDPSLFEMAGVELVGEGKKPRHDRATMETNVPGLYVAGTAAAGTQLGGVKEFIETAHVHVDRILAAITGAGRASAPDARAEALVREAADLPEA